jgi:outer membrane protein assembly factor BamE (lipoprotein component of BamABCDE complex)
MQGGWKLFAGQPTGIGADRPARPQRRTQMKEFSLFYALAAAAALAGCATQEGVRPKWTLRGGDFASISPQKTSKQDVERLVGKPLTTMVFARLGEEVWDYRYMDGVKTHIAEIHFDMQGRTKYMTTYPDQCVLGPSGCR